MVSDMDWGDCFDDMDSEYWENQSTDHDDDSCTLEGSDNAWDFDLDCENSTSSVTNSPYWPQIRNFSNYRNANDFLKFAFKNGDPEARTVPFENGFQVLYRNWTQSELTGYRSGRKYSKLEEKFILREYLMWSPIYIIAGKVDRRESAIALWLSSRGLRVTERNPAYGIGQLDEKCYEQLCDSIQYGWLYDEKEKLLELNILDESSLVSQPGSQHKYFRISLATLGEKKRLMEFAWDYNKLDLGSKFATAIGETKTGFLMGLQSSQPVRALFALDEMQNAPSWLVKVRELTRDYVRFIILEKLPKVLGQWIIESDKRKEYYDASSWSPKDDLIGEQLLAAMGELPSKWTVELRTLYEYFSVPIDESIELRNPDNQLAAWMLLDDLRRSAGYSSSYTDSTRELEMKMKKLETICKNFKPNLENITFQLINALPFNINLAKRVAINLSKVHS